MRRCVFISCGLTCALLMGCSTLGLPKASDVRTEQQEDNTMREYAIVEEVNSNYMILKTTKNDLYRIDSDHMSDLEPGMLLLVVYEPGDKTKNGDFYDVLPVRIEKSDTKVVKSA